MPAAEIAARLGRALDATSTEVYVADGESLRFVHVNRAAVEALGYSEEELLQMTPMDLVPGYSREAFLARIQPLLRGETDELVRESAHRRKDGSVYPVEIRVLRSHLERDNLFVGLVNDVSERHRIAAELSESRQRLETALDGAELAVWEEDLARGLALYDARTEAIIGRKLGDWVTPESLADLVHPDDLERLGRAWRAHVRGTTPYYECDYRVRAADGTWRWLRSRGRVLERDENGRALRAAGTHMDITDRHVMEEALRDSQQRLELALAGASLCAWDSDIRSRTTVFDRTAAETLGRPLEGRVADSVWEALIHPDDLPGVIEEWRRHIRGETAAYTHEYRVQAADGRWIWLHASGRVMDRDAEGRAVRAAGTYRDITEQKLSEQALAESMADLAAMFRNSSDGIIIVAPDSRILRFNATAERRAPVVLGRPLEEGACFREYVGEENVTRYDGQIARALAGETVNFEFEYPSAVGPLWYDFTYAPVQLSDGAVRGVALVLRDINDRKQAERALLQSQKLESLGLLAGGIAHDFNNLLVGILGNAGIALAELPAGDAARPVIEDIETAGQRAAELARQMLAYAGRARFVVQSVDLNAVVGEMAQLLRASMGKDVTLRQRFGAQLPPVEADVTQLRQIVMNLVVNASDAIGDAAGVVTLSTGSIQATSEYLGRAFSAGDLAEGHYVYLDVADTGHGMDAETLNRIFDPFFTTKASGRGLGLAAVLGIVRAHRGAMTVSSTPSRGTVFRLLLPATHVAAPAPAAAGQGAWTSSGTILVVDDEESVRNVTARALRMFGFEVLQAADGEAGVEAFRAAHGELRCVLLDMTMPRLDGEGAFRAMRGIDPSVPVVLLSGYGDDETVSQLSRDGLASFIQKPYRVAELREALRRVIEPA